MWPLAYLLRAEPLHFLAASNWYLLLIDVQAEEALLRHYLLHLVRTERRGLVPLYACHVQPSTREDAYMAMMRILSDQPIEEHFQVFEESHQIFEDWRASTPHTNLEPDAMQSLAEQVCCSSQIT